MNTESRRRFLANRVGSARRCWPPWLPRCAPANPLGRPIGIQLYAVNSAMQEDPAGTLKKIREIGFGEVETAGFGKLSAKNFANYWTTPAWSVPARTCNSTSTTWAQPSRMRTPWEHSMWPADRCMLLRSTRSLRPRRRRRMSLDEAKRTAEIANRIGEAAKRAGLQYAYHNHDAEFADSGRRRHRLRPAAAGNRSRAGQIRDRLRLDGFRRPNPIDYFKKYPESLPDDSRQGFPGAHDKSAAAGGAEMLGAELGHGMIDYKPIFAAAKKAGLRHYFAEQEGPFLRMNPAAGGAGGL